MTVEYKKVQNLLPADLLAHPVWEFAIEREDTDDQLVKWVEAIPVKSLANRIVGSCVRLANGHKLWAIFGNVDLTNAERTQQFMTISFFHRGKWFFLARYHDHDYQEHGPAALAGFLALGKEDVFPVVYDIRRYCTGDPNVVVGEIEDKPKKMLSRAELISLSLP